MHALALTPTFSRSVTRCPPLAVAVRDLGDAAAEPGWPDPDGDERDQDEPSCCSCFTAARSDSARQRRRGNGQRPAPPYLGDPNAAGLSVVVRQHVLCFDVESVGGFGQTSRSLPRRTRLANFEQPLSFLVAQPIAITRNDQEWPPG